MIPKNKNIKTLFETDSKTNKTVPVLTKPLNELESWKLKENKPEVFQIMVNVDAKIRDSSKKGEKNPIYLHPSCKPLSEVKFKNENNYKLFQDFKNDCSGNCGG